MWPEALVEYESGCAVKGVDVQQVQVLSGELVIHPGSYGSGQCGQPVARSFPELGRQDLRSSHGQRAVERFSAGELSAVTTVECRERLGRLLEYHRRAA